MNTTMVAIPRRRRARRLARLLTRKKALRHKRFLLFLTPSALSAAVSEYHAVANGRDTPDSGHDGNHFGRPLDGRNAPQTDIAHEFLFGHHRIRYEPFPRRTVPWHCTLAPFASIGINWGDYENKGNVTYQEDGYQKAPC
jgi:hypothetical protein